MRWAVAWTVILAVTLGAGAGRADDDSPAFSRHIMPIFSKAGCNSGSCHGTFAGKGGFRLSLFGYEPRLDYERLLTKQTAVESIASIRQQPAAPESNGPSPARRRKTARADIPAYQSLLNWIKSGAKYDPKDELSLERVEVVSRRGNVRVESIDDAATQRQGGLRRWPQ